MPVSTITSMRALARTLRRRGHEVSFAGMADCAPHVEPYGFELTALYTDWMPPGFMATWTGGPTSRPWRETLRFYLEQRRVMLRHARFLDFLAGGGHAEFVDAVRRIAPDLILVDVDVHAYWTILAYATGIPTIYVSPILPTVEDPDVPPFTTSLPPATDAASRAAVEAAWRRHFARRRRTWRAYGLAGIPDWYAQIDRLARNCGVPPGMLNMRTLLMPQLDLPSVILVPRELEFPQAAAREHVDYAEACIDFEREEPPFPWERVDPGLKLVFCSLGSIAFSRAFFQTVIDATAREPGWQLVVNIGPRLAPSDFTDVPESAILVSGAPQLALLKRAAAMIHHGGIGSVKECAYFGVPQAVFPIGFDQPGLAARVEFHGVGAAGNLAAATPQSVHALLARLLSDEGVAARCRALSAAVRAREEAQEAAAIIERVAARANRRN
jgi:zeaxanthin glucosyltransferase